jgi:hypothetical protein
VALMALAWMAAVAAGLGQIPRPGVVPVAAPETNLAAARPDLTARPLETRLAEARSNLVVALGDAAVTNTPAGVSPQDIWVRRTALQRLVRIYEQQLSGASELEAIRTRNAEIAREAQGWTRFAEPLPYSILLTDRLREELQTERLKLSTGEAAAATLEQIIEENRKLLAQAEEKIRQINEQLEGAHDPAVAARMSWQRELERVRSQVAAGTVAVLEQERLIGRERAAGSRSRLGLLQRQLVIAEAGAKFTQADLDQVKAQLERQSKELERELAETQIRRNAVVQALEAAREELRLAKGRADTPPAALARIVELISAREAQLQAADTGTRVLRLMLEGANMERAMWELRFAAYDTRSVETLRDSRRRQCRHTPVGPLARSRTTAVRPVVEPGADPADPREQPRAGFGFAAAGARTAGRPG